MVKISNLPDGGDQESGDVLPGVRGGTTQKVSGPLVQSDLAANGGDVVTDDRANTFTAWQDIRVDAGSSWSDSDNRLLYLRGTSDGGFLFSHVTSFGPDSEKALVVSRGGSNAAETIAISAFGSESDALYLSPTKGSVFGAPTGGFQGSAGAINAEALYDNANRVLAPNNTAGGDLPTSDPLVAGQLYNDAGTVKVSSG